MKSENALKGLLYGYVIFLLGSVPTAAEPVTYGSMRNGSFDEPRPYKPDDPGIVEARKAGWKLPDDLVWPAHWSPNAATPNGVLEYVRDGGWKGTPAVRLDGGGHISSYFGNVELAKPYLATVRVKGHGTLRYGAYLYSPDGFVGGCAFVEREVHSDTWLEYQGLFPNDRVEVVSLNLALSATGGLLVDEVQLVVADPAQVEMVRERMALYGTGALMEDLTVAAVQADPAFADRLVQYQRALEGFRRLETPVPQALQDSLEKKVADLDPYLRSEGNTVLSGAYNDMIVLTRVLERLAGKPVEGTEPLTAAPAESPARGYQPGVRPLRDQALTIADVHSTKVLYEENENATTRATVVNTSDHPYTGTLVARMHLDLDEVREIARTPFTLAAGQSSSWTFTYNVGPETYGRGIEVQFLDEKGQVEDTWQEFYAVAAEWFRVHQHTHNVSNKLYEVTPWVSYFNQSHYFAHEPTDFGVCTADAEEYLSGQAGYHVIQAARWAQMAHYKTMGVRHTFYQTFAFCGPMGYEEMRQHPEYVLYDENGQPAVDPIYGGYPNPMELASPLEMGPKRQAPKPYLDRKYTPWQHCAANLAREDVVVFQTQRIKQYAQEHGFDGVYIDGNMGVLAGYGYDGKPNVPSGKGEDFARLSARNHRIFSETLKKENPNFGTWFNWSYASLDWARSMGLTAMIGSGGKGEVSDENIRAATDWKNVMLLMETGSFLQSKEGMWSQPAEFLRLLCDQRDFAVQKWGANTLIGYSFFPWDAEDPGPAKWAWPTVNYLGAQLIATQMHHAGGFLPSYRPTLQFQTRYSGLLWAPDLKVVPSEEKIVQVLSPEELWWKRLVYRRKTAEGYDLIVHLVRIPPTERWDLSWANEPLPLPGVRVRVNLGTGQLQQAWALRPYHFEEPQQPVATVLEAGSPTAGSVTVEVPPFRYHTMVVLRVKARSSVATSILGKSPWAGPPGRASAACEWIPIPPITVTTCCKRWPSLRPGGIASRPGCGRTEERWSCGLRGIPPTPAGPGGSWLLFHPQPRLDRRPVLRAGRAGRTGPAPIRTVLRRFCRPPGRLDSGGSRRPNHPDRPARSPPPKPGRRWGPHL